MFNTKKVEKFRQLDGVYGTTSDDGNNGAFNLHLIKQDYFIICSDGLGWEHVSISKKRAITSKMEYRAPSWSVMCAVKDLFWEKEDTVIQFHPKKSEYVDKHPACLHLWRKTGTNLALPPTLCV